MKLPTFVLEVENDGGMNWGDGEVGEGAVLQLHVQGDGAQMRLPAQRPHGLKHRGQTAISSSLLCLPLSPPIVTAVPSTEANP